MHFHQQGGGAGDTSLGRQNFFPEKGLHEVFFNHSVLYLHAISLPFGFGTRHLFLLHCLHLISEHLDQLISNTFSKRWKKHFDTFKHIRFTDQHLTQ